MSTGYLLGCMRSKFLRRKRILTLIFLGMLIAALGVIIVASVARNRELRTPWYAQRSAKIAFQQPVSPAEAYSALHAEYAAGTINGYALIADADASGGIALGGQEGALWRPVNSDDERYSTGEDLFWIHRQAVPARYFHNLEGLTASFNGFDLQCAGLTYYGLNWDWSDEQPAHRVSLRIDGQRAHVESPILEHVYVGDEWLYIAPVLVGAQWIADHDIPITGVCITLAAPNDRATLQRAASRISAPFQMTTEWNAGRIGALTANEWLYLGVLFLAMLNVASLYDGLIDSYSGEFFIFRKIGASKGAIRKAVLILIASMSACAFAGAWLVYALLLGFKRNHQWLAPLPAGYIGALFLGYVIICSLLALRHTGSVLKSFRKKGSNL